MLIWVIKKQQHNVIQKIKAQSQVVLVREDFCCIFVCVFVTGGELVQSVQVHTVTIVMHLIQSLSQKLHQIRLASQIHLHSLPALQSHIHHHFLQVLPLVPLLLALVPVKVSAGC